MDPVQTETRPGGRNQTKGTTMTSTNSAVMPIRAYSVHFTSENLYATYEYLRRCGDFQPLVRDVDPEGNVSVVPEGTGWGEGEPLTFEETCKQFTSDLMWEVTCRAQELFEDSTSNNDPSKKLFFSAKNAIETAFKRMGWGVDMVSFVPREATVCDDSQTVAIVTPRGISFLF